MANSTASGAANDGEGGSAAEDGVPRGVAVLSREEVLCRRSRRLKRLIGCYRKYYWGLTEEVRVKQRDYYWDFGKSPLEEEDGEGAAAAGDCQKGERERQRCGLGGCKSYAMPLTGYCHSHILLDRKQTLYKACGYVIRSAQSGQITCGKPVLRATVPSLCPVHFQKAQRDLSHALKKVGLNMSCSTRPAPKLHAIIAEYVHQIQQKRREASDATTKGEKYDSTLCEENMKEKMCTL